MIVRTAYSVQHTVNSYRNLARHACMESERCMLNYERHKQRRRYLYTAKVRHGKDWSSRHKIVAEI